MWRECERVGLLNILMLFLLATAATLSFHANSQPQEHDLSILAPVKPAADSELGQEIETLQQTLIQLNRDLFILEEDLLFPSSTQIAVYLSMDVGTYFDLDSVEIKVNDKTVEHYLYTEKQVSALERGGVHRVYVGNIGQGEHQLTAFFHGFGPNKRAYKRGVNLTFAKSEQPSAIELQIVDSETAQQPEFVAKSL